MARTMSAVSSVERSTPVTSAPSAAPDGVTLTVCRSSTTAMDLGPVQWIDAVEHREQRRPAAAVVGPAIELAGGVLGQIGRQLDQLGTHRHCGDLHLAALFQVDHGEESALNRRAACQQAMVAQDQRVVLAEVARQPRALVELKGAALVIVVAEAIVEAHRLVGNRQQ